MYYQPIRCAQIHTTLRKWKHTSKCPLEVNLSHAAEVKMQRLRVATPVGSKLSMSMRSVSENTNLFAPVFEEIRSVTQPTFVTLGLLNHGGLIP